MKRFQRYCTLIILGGFLSACIAIPTLPPLDSTVSISNQDQAESPQQGTITTNTSTPATEVVPELYSKGTCAIGLGLREETRELLIEFKEYPGLVMTANFSLAESIFPELDGWIRTIGGPSLEILEDRSTRAADEGLEYEGLSYGLETSITTPDSEWQDVEKSTQSARVISDRAGKLLVLGPGLRLMSWNESKYPNMAAFTDVWMIQTQRLQELGPGEEYRQAVKEIIESIHEGNPEIQIWAQITFPPDQAPDPDLWLQ
jgi:hypothetical protein